MPREKTSRISKTPSTERSQAEQALRESEAWLDLAETAGGVGTFDWDIEKDTAKCSDQYFRLFGIDPRPGVSLEAFLEQVHEEDVERVQEAVNNTLERDVPYATDYRVRWPDGSIHWISDRARVLKDGDGRPVRFHGAITDITERKQAEEALRESEERYRDYYERAPDAYLSVDPESGSIIECNQTTADLLDRRKEELIGHRIFDFYMPQSVRQVRAALQELRVRGELRGVELQLRRKDGKVIDVSLDATAVRDQSGRVVRSRSMWRDITERKHAEEALQRLRGELELKAEAEVLRGNSYGLTFRELTVLHLVAAGRADKEIARELGISPDTARKHVRNIRTKMKAASRTDAGVRAVREKLID